MLVLRKRKVDMAKDRVNNMGFNVFNESTKTMRVQDVEYMSGEGAQGEMKGSIISTCELETLGTRDPMEQANEFMCDYIILKEEVVFQEEKDMEEVKYSGVEQVEGMSG